MKLKKTLSWLSGATTYVALILLLSGYGNVDMHPAINTPMVDAFISRFVNAVNPSEKLDNMLFVMNGSHTYPGPDVTNPGYFAATMGESTRSFTPKEWIARGGYSCDEPEVPAALRHFYDPLGIDGGKTYLSNRGTYWEWIINNNGINPHINAKDWALTHADNKWSFAQGKGYVLAAIAEQDETRRDAYMAKAWRCLGEVLHLVADMGCPPHVRNDSHAAPVGWTYRRALGDPDPYEELVKDSYVSTYGGGGIDPGVKSVCRGATKAEQVFESLATFTNSNFFTEQTIVGTGGFAVTPAIDDRPAYPSPRLEKLSYNSAEYTYYSTLPGGQKVKMCKDEGYFLQRCTPYIDSDCVESQAAALMPNIIEAGANVIRLFIPKIKVSITSAKEDGSANGTVVMETTPEYDKTTTCQGTVYFLVENGIVGEGSLRTDGSFSVEGLTLKNNDELVAEYHLGGMVVRSEPCKVGDDGFLEKLKAAKGFVVTMSSTQRWSDGRTREEHNAYGYEYYDPSAGITPLSWSGNSFSCSCDFTYDDGNSLEHTTWSINGTVSANGRTILSLTTEFDFSDGHGRNWHDKLVLRNIPFTTGYFGGSDDMDFGDWASSVQNYFVSFVSNDYVDDGSGTYMKVINYVSTDWDSSPQPYIYAQFHE